MTICGFLNKEPQINADERGYNPITDFGAAHRKERKAQPQCGTRMTRIQRILTDPCQSAPSVKSVFYRSCSRMKSIGSKVSAFICVHPRLINLKGQLQAPKKDVKCWRGLINQ
jgi:hypothetical protein